MIATIQAIAIVAILYSPLAVLIAEAIRWKVWR